MQNRRSFFQSTVLTLAGLPAMAAATIAYAKTAMVDTASAMAKALKYVEVSEVKDQNCKNCLQYQYKSETTDGGKKVGPCNLFPGKNVASKGHCTAWVLNPNLPKEAANKKPAAKTPAAKKPAAKAPMKK